MIVAYLYWIFLFETYSQNILENIYNNNNNITCTVRVFAHVITGRGMEFRLPKGF